MEIQDIRTFGRRHTKKLSNNKQYLIDNILPIIKPLKETQKDIILEIGFGGGEHMLELSKRYPDSLIIGSEPFINGVASLLSSISKNNLILDEFKNINIYPDDVRIFLNDKNYKNLKFSKIYILHPDPWPKKKHTKRRLLNSDFLKLISSKLDNQGYIIIGTDHYEYYDWLKEQIINTSLKIKEEISNNELVIKTKYQIKNKANTEFTKYIILENKIND